MSNTATDRMTADKIAELFLARRPDGGWITAKQATWLMGIAHQEELRSRGSHNPRRADGTCSLPDGRGANWVCSRGHEGGAGFLKVTPLPTAEDTERMNSERAYEIACRTFNEKFDVLILAGATSAEIREFIEANRVTVPSHLRP